MNSGSRTGAITLLFTDIEGSTRLWEEEPERMRAALARHDALLRASAESNHGEVVKMTGDGMLAAFDEPLDALGATLAIQCALEDASATNEVALRVRCGLHVGVVERRDNDFFGSPVNRTARIMGAAHGGQALISQAVVDLVRERLPAGVSLRDLGAVRLRDIASAEHVYQLVHPRLRLAFPALRSLEATPNNLPLQVTSFIGRARELVEAQVLLKGARLLTLLGVGGIGKTRLSLQIGADMMDAYPDGVWFVDLAPLVGAGSVVNAVAQALGVREEVGKPLLQKLCGHIKGQRLLLILDNCEHLLDACARLVDAVLRGAAESKIIATSREPLHLAGEQTYPLPTLSLPEPGATAEKIGRSEAVQLFVERARFQQPGFFLTERQAPAVAALCAHLDGIPLALELAAARVRSLSVEEINARLSDRFRLLTGGSRTALPRQQTLRTLIDWSYDLLTDAEKLLFARFSVFAGGWTLDAAEAVVADQAISSDDVVDLLASLVEKSLVVADDTRNRYRMLETIREYAREQLQARGEDATMNDRHLNHFLIFVEKAALELRGGSEGPKWMERLDIEHDNLQAALAWSLKESSTPEAAMRMCWALYRYWLRRARWREGRGWCDAALGRDAGEIGKVARARVFLVAGGMAERLGEVAESKVLCEQALTLGRAAGDLHVEASALNLLSMSFIDRGDYSHAQALLEQAVAINRALGDRIAEVSNVGNLGLLFVFQGKLVDAKAPLERELALARDLGDRYYEASAYRHLGMLAYNEEDYLAAHASHELALAIFRELGTPAGEVEQLRNLAETAVARGEFIGAIAYFEQALKAHRELGYRHSAADCFDGMVGLAVKTEAYLEAAKFCGATDALREAVGALGTPSDIRRNSAYRHRSREVLGDAEYEAAYAIGRSLTTDAAIDEALAWLHSSAQSFAIIATPIPPGRRSP